MKYRLVVIILVLLFAYYTYKTAYGTRVYYFYKDSCQHCAKLSPAWDLFASSCAWSMITPIKINCEKKNQGMRDNFDAKTVPHIVKVRNDIREIYKGDRTSSDILEWSKKPIQL